MPSVVELQTILLREPYPCQSTLCIDETVFGLSSVFYWSATIPANFATGA